MRKLFLLAGMSMLWLSCSKDNPIADMSNGLVRKSTSVGGGGEITVTRGQTPLLRKSVKLGSKLPNPFAIANVRAVFDSLFSTGGDNLQPSHKLVRFKPKDLKELAELEKTELTYSEMPYGYAIMESGTHYTDPTVGQGEIPWLYATIPTGTEFSVTCQTEVLEQIKVFNMNTAFAKAAFQRVGLPYEGDQPASLNGGGGDPPAPTMCCLPGCPDFPACLFPPPPPGPVGKTCDFNVCDNLSRVNGSQNNNGNRAAGVVKVWDTQKQALEGVRRVKVVCQGPFYSEDNYTDDCGAFFGSGSFPIWCLMRVQFSNTGYAKIRNFTDASDVVNYSLPVADWVGFYQTWEIELPWPFKGHIGPSEDINRMNIEYWKGDNMAIDSWDIKYWTSATYWNATIDMHEFACEDQIPPPPHLDVLTTPLSDDGATPMFEDIYGGSLALAGLSAGVVVGFFFEPVTGVILGALTAYVAYFLPDVVLGYGGKEVADMKSDKLKALVYHEYSHAQHYRKAGNIIWQREILYTISNGNANPYGTGVGTLDAERVRLIEGWAYCMGAVHRDRKYGLQHSLTLSSNPADQEYERPKRGLDRKSPSFLESALYYDLIDNTNFEEPNTSYQNGQLTFTPLVDMVNGRLTVRDLYNGFDGNTETISQWKSRLPNLGQNQVHVNSLFSQYGF